MAIPSIACCGFASLSDPFSAQAGVQVGHELVHLLLSKAASEGGHHSLPANTTRLTRIGCGSAAGEGGPAEDRVQSGGIF